MLMMDRVVKMTETGGNFDKGYVEAELDINPDLWFFGCHFIGDPVMPGCLGLDAMWQLVGFYLGWLGGEGKGRALGVGEVKVTGQVLPTAKKVTYRIHFKRIVNRRLIMGLADGEVLVDGRLIYTANDDPVMPGCLGLDAMWQLVGFYLGWLGGEGKGRALGVGEVKFTGQVLPTAKKVTYRIHFKRIVNRRLIMGLADGEVLVDGRLIYTANDLKVGLFQDTSAF